MNWLLWLNMLVAVGVNVHAFVALVISRRKPAPALRRLAKRSGFLACATSSSICTQSNASSAWI